MKARWCAAIALFLLPPSGCSDGGEALPAEYRHLAVPRPRLASEEARRRGRALYLRHCALCHGENADGHGVRQNLSSRAVDFSDPAWRRRTSPRQVFAVTREGIQGTAMAAWKVLDEEETWDVVAYVLSVAETGAGPE